MSFPPSHPALDRALAARGYEEPTPVQSAVLEADQNPDNPHADLLVSAQTGSGKTVAFGLAMASTIMAGAERFGPAGSPLALIIAPTRELALQIIRELDWLYADTGARIAQCVGGMDARKEQRALNAGAHIVVGTPGRLRDHLEREYLKLGDLKVAVLDEADEMLDLGFREELEFILDATPAERRTLLFSATIAQGIAKLARNYQRDAIRIDTTSRSEQHSDIEYRAVRVAPFDIDRAIVNVLRYFEAPSALVFCQTREAVRTMHATLRDRGFDAVGLSGEMSQRERTDALQSLRDGRARVCVATDVAARGLDLPDLGLVVHADLPSNKATLLHRSGRTGRAGKKGVSVLMVTHTKRRKCEQILQSANINAIWQGPPSAAEIRAQDRARLVDHSALTETVTEDDIALAQLVLEKYPPEHIAAALMRMLRAKLPEPEDVSDDNRLRDAQKTPLRERRDAFERVSDNYERPQRSARPERAPRDARPPREDAAWFHLNVGRNRNADPKWLVPMICRLGQITKADIGSIRIFDMDTKFEIVGDAVASFTELARATLNDESRITPTSAPDAEDARPRPAFAARAPSRPREDRKRWQPDDAPAADMPAPETIASGIADVTPVERPAFDKRPRREQPHAEIAPDVVASEHAPVVTPRPRPEKPAREDRKPRWDPSAAPVAEAAERPAFTPRPDRQKRDDSKPAFQKAAFPKKEWPKKDRAAAATFTPRRDKPKHEARKAEWPRTEAAAAPGEKPQFPPRPRQRVRQREERNAVSAAPATESTAPRAPRDPNKPAWAKPAKHAHGKPFHNRADSVTGASKRDGLDMKPGDSQFQHRKGPRKPFAGNPGAASAGDARSKDGKRPFTHKPRSTAPGDRPAKRGKPVRRQP